MNPDKARDVIELDEAIKFHENMMNQRLTDLEFRDQCNRVRWLTELQDLRAGISDGERRALADASKDAFIIRSTREEVDRLNELLESTKKVVENQREEIQRLKDEKAALVDVIADLKMDPEGWV